MYNPANDPRITQAVQAGDAPRSWSLPCQWFGCLDTGTQRRRVKVSKGTIWFHLVVYVCPAHAVDIDAERKSDQGDAANVR